MRPIKAAIVVLLGLAVLAPHTRAQSLPVGLFERYLENLRQQAGIPGLSVAILENRRVVWDAGLGHRELDGFLAAAADTPYPLLDLSQTFSSTLLLQQCVEMRHLELADRVTRWIPQFSEPDTTVAQLLAHSAPGNGFRYDLSRYESVGTIVAQCTSDRFARLAANDILDRLGMVDSVPGHELGDDRRFFSSSAIQRYEAVLQRVATPYHVDSNGRATRSSYTRPSLTSSTGLVSTVRDLARFDAALDDDGVLLRSGTRQNAWETLGSTPTGLGWYVQRYNGERIVWHFGLARDAYSALYIKIPGRNLTLILLANSDRLAAPYNLSNGDVTTSIFAQLFLKLFIG